jgi:hypothetical protein
MTAPRRTRSLLRQPHSGPWGRRATPHGPRRTHLRPQTPRPRLHSRLRAPQCGRRELVGARFGRCDLGGRAFAVAKALAVCGIGATVLWSGAVPALGDDATPPPATTTADAPPPDPYVPPARAHVVKPRPVAPVRTKSVAPARTYTPPAPTTARPSVQTSRPQRHAKTVRRHPRQPVRHHAKAPPVSTWLAPLSQVVTAARIPLPSATRRSHPYLWLAGLAFAVLAVAGLSLHMLSIRYFDLRFE